MKARRRHDFRFGTGKYIDPERTTYVVKGQDNRAILVLLSGTTLGYGDAARTVMRTDGKLVVVSARLSRSEDSGWHPIVLEDDMAGWWETSGEVVFTTEEPAVGAATQPPQVPAASTRSSAVAAPTPRPAPAATKQADWPNRTTPQWVYTVVEQLAANFTVAAGPYRSVLLGQTTEAGVANWYNAAAMDTTWAGNFTRSLQGRYRPVILTRLRQHADTTFSAVPMHTGGPVVLEDDWWVSAAPPSEGQQLCLKRDSVTVEIGRTMRLQRLMSPRTNAEGAVQRLVCVLAAGDLAWQGRHPLEMVVQCPPGSVRNVLFVVERPGSAQHSLAVHGLTILRPLAPGSGPQYWPYDGPKSAALYLAYPQEHKGRQKVCVVELPQ